MSFKSRVFMGNQDSTTDPYLPLLVVDDGNKRGKVVVVVE